MATPEEIHGFVSGKRQTLELQDCNEVIRISLAFGYLLFDHEDSSKLNFLRNVLFHVLVDLIWPLPCRAMYKVDISLMSGRT